MALRRHLATQEAALARFASTQSQQGGGKYVSWVVQDGIAVATFDDPDAKVNTLNLNMQAEIQELLTKVESEPAIKAVILKSGKPNNFIAGADIEMLKELTSVEAAEKAIAVGHEMMNAIANSKKPFIAAINGQCMGGGLEVALACHYRICTTNPKSVLSLPEVKLGLLPGAGGTQRLPRLVGVQGALDMMLTGKNIRPAKAKKMGLVNQVCDPYALDAAAIQAAEGLIDGSLKIPARKQNLQSKIIEGPAKSIMYKKAREMVMGFSLGNYPAPEAILRCVEKGMEGSMEKGLKMELEEFAKLTQTYQSEALISLFFGMNDLKKSPYGQPKHETKTVGVLGAGLMGAGIAQVTLPKGYKTLLKDVDAAGVSRGVNVITSALDKKVKRKMMNRFDADKTLAGLFPLTDSEDWGVQFKKCDLVIEAVPESLALKHKVIQAVEEHLPEHAVFATNTSAIPIRDIAKGSKRPERVVGMHYFSPVDKMMLLELIAHEGTDPDAMAVAAQVGMKQGKIVLPCKDVPGFFINRSLGPYIAEAVALLQEGADPMALDKALKQFGFPVGPISLVDEVGLDVAAHVQDTLAEDLGIRMAGGNKAALEAMVSKNLLGRKSPEGGFFTYPDKSKMSFFDKLTGNKPKKAINPKATAALKEFMPAPKKFSDEEMAHRMAARFANEASFCLQDEIITNAHHGDVASVFGIGFPPFRGGPFRWIDTMGVGKFVDMMKGFEQKHGGQFTPAPLLVDMAKNNKSFHKK